MKRLPNPEPYMLGERLVVDSDALRDERAGLAPQTYITNPPLNQKGDTMRIGQLVRITTRRMFRIGIITHGGQTAMISIWRNNGRTWTQPQAHTATEFEPIALGKLDARKRSIVATAQANVPRGLVSYKGGSTMVGTPLVLP